MRARSHFAGGVVRSRQGCPPRKQRAMLRAGGLLGRCWGRTWGGGLSLIRSAHDAAIFVCVYQPLLPWVGSEPYNPSLVLVCARGLVLPTGGRCGEGIGSCRLNRAVGLRSLPVLGKLSHAAFSVVLRLQMCFLSLASFLVTSFSDQTCKGPGGTWEVTCVGLLLCDSGLHHWWESSFSSSLLLFHSHFSACPFSTNHQY